MKKEAKYSVAKEIESLQHKVRNGSANFTDGELVYARGLIITDVPVKSTAPENVLVITKHAHELSGIFRALYPIFSGPYAADSCRIAAFQRIGRALQAELEYGDNRGRLIQTLFDEASAVAGDFNRGLYFAYGSNMDEAQMSRRCPDAELIGRVFVQDHRFCLDSRGVATIVPCPGSTVEGLLWTITVQDRIKLDIYEGISSGCYRRKFIKFSNRRLRGTAMVYLSNFPEDTRQSRSGYMERIVQAARDHEFSESYIHMLEAVTE